VVNKIISDMAFMIIITGPSHICVLQSNKSSGKSTTKWAKVGVQIYSWYSDMEWRSAFRCKVG